ncbi:hypothetical protein BDY24DRAFT_397673 [Mrakia frigida]|uniref:uncharacterized protein n=1 Tax=Mrakia frigida TaxID=29902 RepID=UPI003FCBFAE6
MDPSVSDAIFNHSAAPSPAPGQQSTNSTPPTTTTVEGSATSPPPSSTSTPSPATDAPIQAPAPQKREPVSLAGLETEVGQVLGSLRSFWGGVQKQVAPALESVRKDLSLAAVQAKQELERLQSQAADARARGESADFANLAMEGSVGMATAASPSDSKDGATPPALTSEQKGKGKEVPPLAEKLSNQAQTLFHRLQASLPTVPAAAQAPTTTTTTNPDGTTTTTITPAPPTRSLPTLASFQSTLSSHLSSNPHLTLDLPALRASLTTNFQKLQTDLHLADAEKLAEEYLKKSEGVLKEAGRYLQEAVKVVPPIDGGETGTTGGVSWDGSDVWTLPSPASKVGGSVIFSQTDAQVAALTGLSTKSVRAKRKDALLRQLRSDRAVLEVDPAAEEVDEDVRSLWKKWIKEEVEAQGGITGDEWTAKTWAELGPGGEGVEELKATRDALVPSKLTKDEFWTRYFFRVHQIETDEQRRKSVLDASAPAEDDLFSWDDEEASEAPSTTTTKPVISTQPIVSPVVVPAAPSTTAPLAASAPTPTSPEPAQQTTPTSKSPVPVVRAEPPLAAPVVAKEGTSAATSPRDSEESYDLVSETSGLAASSRAASSKGDEQEAPKKKAAAAETTEEDEDSDWE